MALGGVFLSQAVVKGGSAMKKAVLSQLMTLLTIVAFVILAGAHTVSSETAPSPDQFLGVWTGDFDEHRGGVISFTILPHQKGNRFHYELELRYPSGKNVSTSSQYVGRMTYEDGILKYRGKCLRANLKMVDNKTLKGPYENTCRGYGGTWVLKAVIVGGQGRAQVAQGTPESGEGRAQVAQGTPESGEWLLGEWAGVREGRSAEDATIRITSYDPVTHAFKGDGKFLNHDFDMTTDLVIEGVIDDKGRVVMTTHHVRGGFSPGESVTFNLKRKGDDRLYGKTAYGPPSLSLKKKQ